MWVRVFSKTANAFQFEKFSKRMAAVLIGRVEEVARGDREQNVLHSLPEENLVFVGTTTRQPDCG